MEIRDDNKMSNDLSTWFQSTGKSMSEALILASTNPKYDKILFIDLPVQYMTTGQELFAVSDSKPALIQ